MRLTPRDLGAIIGDCCWAWSSRSSEDARLVYVANEMGTAFIHERPHDALKHLAKALDGDGIPAAAGRSSRF